MNIDQYIEETDKLIQANIKGGGDNAVGMLLNQFYGLAVVTKALDEDMKKFIKSENTMLLKAMPCSCHTVDQGDDVIKIECEKHKQLEERK